MRKGRSKLLYLGHRVSLGQAGLQKVLPKEDTPATTPNPPSTLLIPFPMAFLSPGSEFWYLLVLRVCLRINTQKSQLERSAPSNNDVRRRNGNMCQEGSGQSPGKLSTLTTVSCSGRRRGARRAAGAAQGRMKYGSGAVVRLRFLSPGLSQPFGEGEEGDSQAE